MVMAAVLEKVVFKTNIAPLTLAAAGLVGVLPDLDGLAAAVFGQWQPGGEMLTHHRFITHTPLFFLAISLLFGLVLGPRIGLLFGVVTLTHLLFDSWGTDDGVMWLWPFNAQQFAVFPYPLHGEGLFGVKYYLSYVRNWRAVMPEALLFLGGMAAAARMFILRQG